MRLMHIAPPIYFNVSTESCYRFALGQYLQPGSDYLREMHNSRRAGAFIMVDNGEAEGEPVADFELLVDQTQMFADEWVLPDSYRNSQETVSKTLAGAQFVPPNKRAICPQGDTIDEWISCWKQIDWDLQGRYRTICLPKHLERFEGGRGGVLLEVLEGLERSVMYDIHCLGIWSDPIREIRRIKAVTGAAYGLIRSLDTGAALAWAQWMERVDETDEGDRFSLEWEDTFNVETRNLAFINCELMREVASGKFDVPLQS